MAHATMGVVMAKVAERLFAAMLLLGIAGCATPVPQGPSVRLPNDAIAGAGDPMRSALISASSAFANQNRLAGQPAAAARAIAQMEFVAAELPRDPRFTSLSPTVPPQLRAARAEWRSAVGIAPDAAPQDVVTTLFQAARALDNGVPSAAAASLPVGVFGAGGNATLARLASLPALPVTNNAAVAAADALRSRDGPSGRSL